MSKRNAVRSMARRAGRLAALAWLAAVPLAAQVEIDRRRPAAPKGEVRIDNDFGSITLP